MKKGMFVLLLAALLVAGCGASKDYVNQQISDSEARMNAKVDAAQTKADANATDIANLQSLAQQLQDSVHLAINKAAGFENYQIIWTGEIRFAFDSYAIDQVASKTLDEAGDKLEANPGSILEIAGHTDRTGSADYNYMLGQERSSSAKRYLAERFGISMYRMFTISYGKDKPVALPDEQKAASKNRRVMLTIWGPPQ
jgi:outer membrane protein OmpA-like peptidoglycan-associated protein